MTSMKNIPMKTLIALMLVTLPMAALKAEPVRIIFDTDLGNDIDDALALGMIHSLETRGACNLLAVTTTKDHPLSAALIDAINTFYGIPDVPVGAVRHGATPEEGYYFINRRRTTGPHGI